MIRDIIQEPDPILRRQMPDATTTKQILTVVKDLKDTMHDSQAAGFAANQIGEEVNICIVAARQSGVPEQDKTRKIWQLVNPKIVFFAGRQLSTEGCFSIPGYAAIIPRSMTVRVACADKLYEFTGIEAWIAQHEIEHLQGILIRDYVENTHGRKGGVLLSTTLNNRPVVYREERAKL
jgi:peptide deformylase